MTNDFSSWEGIWLLDGVTDGLQVNKMALPFSLLHPSVLLQCAWSVDANQF